MQQKLAWDENEVTVDSVEDLAKILDRLVAEAESDLPLMAALVREDGSSLSIGVGREESVSSYVSGSLDPPYDTTIPSTAPKADPQSVEEA